MQPSPDSSSAVTVTLQRGNGRLDMRIAGRLDAATLPLVWTQAVGPAREQHPEQLVVNVTDLTYCDGAGLAPFAELRRVVLAHGGEMRCDAVRHQ